MQLRLAYHKAAWLGVLLRWKGSYHGFYIEPDFRTSTLTNLKIGPGVVIQRRGVISMKTGALLSIGKDTRIGSDAVIAVQERVEIGKNVLTAARLFIADHNHEFQNSSIPVMHQGGTRPDPVQIGDGSWLGINVCVLAGVKLGRNCVVGANSVVTKSFPDFSVVVGIPARLVRTLQPDGSLPDG